MDLRIFAQMDKKLHNPKSIYLGKIIFYFESFLQGNLG